MDSFLGREGKKNLFCTAGGWLTQVPPLVCVCTSQCFEDTLRDTSTRAFRDGGETPAEDPLIQSSCFEYDFEEIWTCFSHPS